MALQLYKLHIINRLDGTKKDEWFRHFNEARRQRKEKKASSKGGLDISLEKVTLKRFTTHADLALAILNGNAGDYILGVDVMLHAHAP